VLLVLGTAGFFAGWLLARVGAGSGSGVAAAFTDTAHYKLFSLVLGLEMLFYAIAAPVCWFTVIQTRRLYAPAKLIWPAVVLALLAAFLMVALLPLLAPELAQIARHQRLRTDVATIVAFLAVVAPCFVGIITLRMAAQERPQFKAADEMIRVGQQIQSRLRFYLAMLAAAIGLGVVVLSTIRSAVAEQLGAIEIDRDFPSNLIVLYGAAFSVILLVVYGPAERALNSWLRAETDRLCPLDESTSIPGRYEAQTWVEGRLEMSTQARLERMLTIVSPFLTSLLTTFAGL
jgi:hypothetical protein